MKSFRALAGAVAVGGLVTTTVLGGTPAKAVEGAQPEVFLGSAAGTALRINALGQDATIGGSKAAMDSTLKATASGIGAITALATNKSAVTGLGQSDPKTGEKCTNPSLPVTAVSLGLACTRSSTELLAGVPKASSLGYVTGLNVSANNVLSAVPVDLNDNAVISTLEGIFGTLPSATRPVTDTLGQVLDGIVETQTLSAKIGPSVSEVSGTVGSITSASEAKAAQIDILPTGALDGGPLLSILVSSAKASATYDRVTGTSTPVVDPALVTVKLGKTPLLPNGQTVTVAPGTSACYLDLPIATLGSPLKSCITVAAGSTSESVDPATGKKVVSAVADGVKLELLTGLNGGIVLELAHAEASVAGSPAVTPPVNPQAPILNAPPTELPRTGGLPMLPMAATSLMGLAVFARRLLMRAR